VYYHTLATSCDVLEYDSGGSNIMMRPFRERISNFGFEGAPNQVQAHRGLNQIFREEVEGVHEPTAVWCMVDHNESCD